MQGQGFPGVFSTSIYSPKVFPFPARWWKEVTYRLLTTSAPLKTVDLIKMPILTASVQLMEITGPYQNGRAKLSWFNCHNGNLSTTARHLAYGWCKSAKVTELFAKPASRGDIYAAHSVALHNAYYSSNDVQLQMVACTVNANDLRRKKCCLLCLLLQICFRKLAFGSVCKSKPNKVVNNSKEL